MWLFVFIYSLSAHIRTILSALLFRDCWIVLSVTDLQGTNLDGSSLNQPRKFIYSPRQRSFDYQFLDPLLMVILAVLCLHGCCLRLFWFVVFRSAAVSNASNSFQRRTMSAASCLWHPGKNVRYKVWQFTQTFFGWSLKIIKSYCHRSIVYTQSFAVFAILITDAFEQFVYCSPTPQMGC